MERSLRPLSVRIVKWLVIINKEEFNMSIQRLSQTLNIVVASIFMVFSQSSFAVGTASGTDVLNSVTVDYKVNTVDQTQLSDTATFKVDNKVWPIVTMTSGATVTPGQSDQVLTFLLTNNGNTTQGYRIEQANSSVGDSYDMDSVQRYYEVLTAGWASGDDTEITTTNRQFDLAAGATKIIYIVADVPLTATNTQTATYDLLITTLDASTENVTADNDGVDWTSGSVQVVYAEGTGGPHASDADNDGLDSVTATYTVSSAALTIVKSQDVTADGFSTGPNFKAIPGATVTYTLTLANTGAQTAATMSVADTLPATMTYVVNSVDVDDGNGNTDTNITDSNSGANTGATVTISGQLITVSRFTVLAADTAVITFDATIN